MSHVRHSQDTQCNEAGCRAVRSGVLFCDEHKGKYQRAKRKAVRKAHTKREREQTTATSAPLVKPLKRTKQGRIDFEERREYRMYKETRTAGLPLPKRQRRVRVPSEDQIEFIDEMIEANGTSCVEWPFNINQARPIIHFEGKTQCAVRLALARSFFDEPGKALVKKPVCDNPLCVEPNHHKFGDSKDIKRIMKLTDAQARQVKKYLASGHYTHLNIAEYYGVSVKYISRIASGDLFAHVGRKKGEGFF